MISFRVHGLPQTQGSVRALIPKGRTFPVVVHSDAVELRSWRNAVAAAAAQARDQPGLIEGPVAVEMRFFLLAPKGRPLTDASRWTHLQRKRYAWPAVRPDLDRLQRGILDALTGVLWRDDGQVVHLDAMKQYDDDPGVTVRVYRMDPDLVTGEVSLENRSLANTR